uniref:Uncharacterized protein n=1 Tax=Anopheles quadriannulatus TaxID=34691 RepID=A0A182XSV7_ANOQN
MLRTTNPYTPHTHPGQTQCDTQCEIMWPRVVVLLENPQSTHHFFAFQPALPDWSN